MRFRIPRHPLQPRRDPRRHRIGTRSPAADLALVDAEDDRETALRPVQRGQGFAEAGWGHGAALATGGGLARSQSSAMHMSIIVRACRLASVHVLMPHARK